MRKNSLIGLGLAFALSCACVQADELSAAVAAYGKGKFVEAAQVFRKVIGREPKNASAYYYLACCYYRLGQTSDAATLYKTVTRQFAATNEAKLSQQMLASIAGTAGATAPAGSTGAVRGFASPAPGRSSGAGRGPSDDSDSSDDTGAPAQDLGSLPDTNRFYFKRTDSGHMETDAFINGRPLKVWFDTGAGAHFGFNHLKPLGIIPPARKADGFTRGWAGKTVPVWDMVLPVRLGNMTRNLNCTVEEEMNLSPLVGQDFIRGYTYEIDDKAGCLTMKKQNTTSQTVDTLYDVPCVKRGKDDFVPLEVNGKKCEAFIDTGASNTILHPSTLQQLGVSVPEDAPVMMMQGVGGSVPMVQMDLNLCVGPIRRQGFSVLVGGKAGNCIGQDFMSGWRFTVDRQRNLMRFFH